MSMAIFNGLIGRIKVLLDRITPDRAEALDHLDADILSRAPASTALTNAVWSDALASLLGDTAGKPVLTKPPVASGVVNQAVLVASPGAFVDVLDIPSGDGYVTLLTIDGSAIEAQLLIDGVVVCSLPSSSGQRPLVGSILQLPQFDGSTLSYSPQPVDSHPVFFVSSIKVRAKGSGAVSLKYVRTR